MGQRQVVQGGAVAVGQRVLAMCNILPCELHAVESQACLLVAYYANGERLAVQPPPDLPHGAGALQHRVRTAAVDPRQKDNAWDLCKAHFSTDAEGCVFFRSRPFQINGLPCKVEGGAGAEF